MYQHQHSWHFAHDIPKPSRLSLCQIPIGRIVRTPCKQLDVPHELRAIRFRVLNLPFLLFWCDFFVFNYWDYFFVILSKTNLCNQQFWMWMQIWQWLDVRVFRMVQSIVRPPKFLSKTKTNIKIKTLWVSIYVPSISSLSGPTATSSTDGTGS